MCQTDAAANVRHCRSVRSGSTRLHALRPGYAAFNYGVATIVRSAAHEAPLKSSGPGGDSMSWVVLRVLPPCGGAALSDLSEGAADFYLRFEDCKCFKLITRRGFYGRTGLAVDTSSSARRYSAGRS